MNRSWSTSASSTASQRAPGERPDLVLEGGLGGCRDDGCGELKELLVGPDTREEFLRRQARLGGRHLDN